MVTCNALVVDDRTGGKENFCVLNFIQIRQIYIHHVLNSRYIYTLQHYTEIVKYGNAHIQNNNVRDFFIYYYTAVHHEWLMLRRRF